MTSKDQVWVGARVGYPQGWKDERMVRRCIRKLGALEGGMAQFFGRGGE